MKSDIGVIGLAVMGKNLALNIESKGRTASCQNLQKNLSKRMKGRGISKERK